VEVQELLKRLPLGSGYVWMHARQCCR
jgi:hypothetical protein